MKSATALKGIQFLTDEKGKKTAVQIDLKMHGELWEDIYDSILAAEREKEPTVPLEEVENKLRHMGKLND